MNYQYTPYINREAKLRYGGAVQPDYLSDELVSIRLSLAVNPNELPTSMGQLIRSMLSVTTKVAPVPRISSTEELSLGNSGKVRASSKSNIRAAHTFKQFDVPIELLRIRVIERFASKQIESTKQFVLSLDKDAEIKKVIGELNDLDYPLSAKRIQELWELKDEDFEYDEKRLAIDIAFGFSEFMSKFKSEFKIPGEPIIGLCPEGTLLAEWRLEGKKFIALEFLSRTIVCYGITSPEIKDKTKESGLDGEGKHDFIINSLSKNGLSSW